MILEEKSKETELRTATRTGAINFTELDRNNYGNFIEMGQKCPYLPACYSAGFLIMWKDVFNASFAEVSGCAVIRLNIKGKVHFLYPYPVSEDGDLTGALTAIEKYTAKSGIPLVFYGIPRDRLPDIALRYNNLSFSARRNESDYIYSTSDMQNFSGRKFSGQRNHLNKFNKLCRDARFRAVYDSEADRALLGRFWEKYEAGFSSDHKLAEIELGKAKEYFMSHPAGDELRACLERNGEIIAVCLGEVWGESLIIHIEKALDECQGAYQFMVTNFARAYGNGCRYINREDDAGARGLRISKMQYHPLKLEENILAEVKNELSMLRKPPFIETKNLTLDLITERDIEPYNRLSLDIKHNKYWGYDYREHIDGEPPYDYFYRDAIRDYDNRMSMTLAIRLGGSFIGEAVINEFDMRGSVNLGLRLLPEYTGHGYGREAFAALADYALYRIGLSAVTAYCYKQNASSLRMLSSCMERVGEDEVYYFFRRTN